MLLFYIFLISFNYEGGETIFLYREGIPTFFLSLFFSDSLLSLLSSSLSSFISHTILSPFLFLLFLLFPLRSSFHPKGEGRNGSNIQSWFKTRWESCYIWDQIYHQNWNTISQTEQKNQTCWKSSIPSPP